MRGIICFLTLTLVLAWAPWPAGAEDRALLIGVGKYRLSGIDLPGIDRDIAAMRRMARRLGFKPGQIKTLENQQATRSAIRQAMREWLIEGVTPEDRVLFHFSGHGSQIPDLDGDEGDGVDEVLMTYDAGFERQRLVRTFEDDEFGRLLARIPARTVLIFIDACHSGTATKGYKSLSVSGQDRESEYYRFRFFYYPGMPRGLPSGGRTTGRQAMVSRAVGSSNYVSLSAARDDEQAIGTEKGGFFTRAIVAAVEEAARAGRPITMEDLEAKAAGFIRSKVTVPKLVHRPQLFGNMQMAKVNLFRSITPGQQTTVTPTTQPTVTASIPAKHWSALERLADKASYRLGVKTNKTRFKVGDALIINCRVTRAGYLNVLNVSPGDNRATVLFPNKFHRNNRVKANTTVTIPGPGDAFVLRARPPLGRSLVVVIHTKNKINAYQEGEGSVTSLFKTLSTKSLKGFTVEKNRPGGYGAAKIITVLED